ncbi:MAG: sodium-independent anion transporter, partial [Azoarcus sp.]|nr:sodium-independent anion transporter [Azoarcus sp.]
ARDSHPEIVILDLDKVISIDTTGLDILQTLHRSLQKRDAVLILCGLGKQPGSLIRRSGFLERLGAENVHLDLAAALEHTRRKR